jgi:hypothetical protein
VNRFALKFNLAAAGGYHTRNGHQSSGFAGAIRTDKGDNLAFIDIETHPFKGLNIAVVGFYVFNIQHIFRGKTLQTSLRGAIATKQSRCVVPLLFEIASLRSQ